MNQEGSAAFGKAFEDFIVREVQSYLSYKRTEQRLHYWRTFDQYGFNIIVLGSFGCEVKVSERVTDQHFQSRRVLKKENLLPRHLVVCGEQLKLKPTPLTLWILISQRDFEIHQN